MGNRDTDTGIPHFLVGVRLRGLLNFACEGLDK